jgi:dethiobiotin synthase
VSGKRYFVSGIGTGVGKTVASAILVEALGADYWKPIQAGNLNCSDSDRVRALVSNPRSVVHKDTWRLTCPLSPHAAAHEDGLYITPESLAPPNTENTLIIESTGGLLVPINDHQLLIDAVPRLKAEIIVVSRHYLGSINHTLLTLEAVRHRELPLLGIIFNGPPTPTTEAFILNYTGMACLGRIGEEPVINRETVRKYAEKMEWP